RRKLRSAWLQWRCTHASGVLHHPAKARARRGRYTAVMLTGPVATDCGYQINSNGFMVVTEGHTLATRTEVSDAATWNIRWKGIRAFSPGRLFALRLRRWLLGERLLKPRCVSQLDPGAIVHRGAELPAL